MQEKADKMKTPGPLTKMQIADVTQENRIQNYGHYGWINFIPLIGGIIRIILTQSAFNQYWDRALAAYREKLRG